MKIKMLAVVVLLMCGCGTTRDLVDKWKGRLDDFKEWDKLSAEELWDQLRGKEAKKDEKGWLHGSQKIDVPERPKDWSLTIYTKDIPTERVNDKPERMFVKFFFDNGSAYPYIMPKHRDYVRFRAKGGTNYNAHVKDWVLKPIPRDVAEWTFSVKDGKFDITCNGDALGRKGKTAPKNYLPLDIGDGKLKTFVVSPDGVRPLGCPWWASEVTQNE